LVIKRKRRATTPPAKHSHSDGRTPYLGTAHSKGHQEVNIVPECEAGSSRGKSLWDPSFDIPTHGEPTFLPSDDKDWLIAQDEVNLYLDAMKHMGQAFAMGCLVVSKTKALLSALAFACSLSY